MAQLNPDEIMPTTKRYDRRPKHHIVRDGSTLCGTPVDPRVAIADRAAAETVYGRLFACYITRWPYGPGRGSLRATETGYILSLEDVAMIAFGLDEEGARERVAEDYADYVAGLG